MTLRAQQEGVFFFILYLKQHQPYFPAMNEVEGMCTPVFKPVKHTHELRSNVNAMNKKLKTSVKWNSLCPDKKLEKSGRKVIHHKPVHVG